MSFTTMNQGGQQDGGYGGGKSAGAQPLYKSVIEGANQTTGQMPGVAGQIANMVTNTAGNIMDQTYRGGPPQLDLSGMMPKTPAQKVAESQAGGGILKLRQPKPFDPNPTPTPMPMPGIDPGFGGGKGIFNPGGPGGGFGGGKNMPGLPYERQPGNNPQMGLPVERQYGNNPQMGLPVERQY